MSELRLWVSLSRVSPEQVDGEALCWAGPTRDRKEDRGNRRCWEDLPAKVSWLAERLGIALGAVEGQEMVTEV